MAQGTLTMFNEFALSHGDGRIDLDSDTLKIAFVSVIPSATDAVPTWGAGGTTNISANEVSAGGGYTAGGNALASVTYTKTAGVGKLSCANPAWVSSASGDPTNIKAAVVYSDTATNKDCLGFADLTPDGSTAISLLTGDVTLTVAAGGLMTFTVNA